MSKFFKSMFLLLSAGLFTATSWAETYTATNVSIAAGSNGGGYDWAQFKFTDAQMVITNSQSEAVDADAVSDLLDVKSVAILRRSGKTDWTNTITVELRTSDGSTVLTNGTSGALTTEEVTIGGNSQKWMVFAFENPVRISKNTIYRIKTSSGGQQYFMSNVSGKTGSNNTSILASGDQGSYSPHVRVVADSVAFEGLTRTISNTENWTDEDWGGEAPTEVSVVKLTADGAAKLNLDAAASVSSLTIDGTGSLTITGTNTLTAATTIVKANTIVETSASLGAVTLENDATLTVKSLNAFTSIAGEGTLALDLGDEADVEYTGNFPTTVKLSLLSGSLTYKHNGADRAIKALNIAERATFADVANYKHHLTINDKFSGAGTYLVKVPTESSQTDGWRYLFVNGDAAEFTGNVKLQIKHNANQNGGAPYRTGMCLRGTFFGGTVTAEATGEGVTDADLAYAHLDIDESLTMTKAQSFAGKIDIASGKTLTAANGVTLTNAGKLEGTGTIAAPFTYSSTAETSFAGILSGELTVSAGVLELAAKQNSVANTVGVTVNGGVLRLDVDHNGINDNNVVFAEGRTITVNAGGVLELERGYGYFKIAGSGLTKVVDSNFYFGVSGGGTNNITTALEVAADKTFWVRNWGGTNYKLTPASVTLNGNLKRNTAAGNGAFTVETSSLKGSGTVEGMTLALADNATIDVTVGAVAATTTAILPDAFTVKISADQDATGVVTVMTSPNVVITDKTATVWVGEDEAEYTLRADAATVWVEKAGVELLETVEVTFTEGGTLVLSDALDGKALAPNATLEINFGNKGENEQNPGIFEFDCDAAFAQITITGTNGGTITKTGAVTVTATATTIDADTTVNAGAANLGTVTINAEKTLTVKEDWTNVAMNVPTTATNLGKIRFDGGSAETPIVFSMGSSANGNPGALVMAPGSYVKLMSYHTGQNTGNKVYNITGETDGEKPNVYLYASKGWGMSDGSVVRNVKLIVPSADNNDFWLRPGVTDATVDLELQGRKLTGDSGNGAIVLGDFVTNAEVVANGKSLSVQTGRISGTAGFDSAIAVDNSGAGSFTVARTYSAALTIGSNGRVTVDEGGSLTGAVSVTGALTYATNATATNTITNNGTITADSATVDLTGATITGSGTYGVTNGGTLILSLAQTTGKTIAVAKGATLKVALAANEQLADQSVTVTGTGGSVQFVDANNHETVLSDSNTYTAPLNIWTNEAGDAAWGTEGNWSNGVPGETDNVKIQITGDTTLVLPSDVTVAALRVVGSGTLTITGGKLTATFIDAETAISASDETLALVPMTIAENVAVTYGTTADAAMPAVTGLGGFVKTGTAKLTLDNATACEATIDVTGGTLELSGNPGGAWTYAYSGVYRFIAREGTTIDIANAFIDMPSTESEITLKGGALLNIKNGNTWENRRSIGAKILIEESSAEKPAIIKGSTNGDYSKLTGGITGSGVLEIQGNGNTFAITGAIKDQENAQLAVKINTANGVTFSGANTYTGGTEVAANALLMVNTFGNLGNSGTINVQGKLQFSNSSNSGTNNQDENAWARLQGSGTIQFENASGNNWYAIRSIATTLDVVNNNRDPNTQDTDDHGGLVVTHDATIGTLFGEGWFRSDLNNSNRTLTIVQSKASEFSGYFKSYANSGGRKLNVLVQSNDATPKTLTLSGNSIHGANDADVNTLTIDTTGSVCLTGSWQGNLTNNGILSGRGTITGTLTFGNAAMLDVSAGEILTANMLADLPAELTVKVANALEVGGTLDIMTTTATPNTALTTVTVKVGKEAVKGIYSLVATGTTLQLVRGEDSLMGSVYLADSNAALTEKVDSGKMGDGDQWGVQIDMDAAKPYGPGWQATQALKTFSVVRAKNDVSQSWENMTVSIVDIEDTTTVLATSEVGVEETDYILTYSGGGTEGRKLLTFTFATAVNLDASKTYQFRFNEARKIRMIHIQSISDDAKNTNAINVLNSNFVVEKATEYTPIVELGVEIPALVIEASVAPVDVPEVPTTLALDTASFMGGYGTTYTVLNYTGEDEVDWSKMSVDGLPADAEVITTDKTWGFAIKTLVIYPIGDSITHGRVRHFLPKIDGNVDGGYRLPLYQRLSMAGYTVQYVGASSENPAPGLEGQIYHDGHSGWMVDDGNSIYDNVRGWSNAVKTQAGRDPDVITLLLGVNDLNNSENYATTAQQMKLLLWRLAGIGEPVENDTPLYPNTKILLAEVLDSTYSANLSENIGQYNATLRTFVENLTLEQGKNRIRMVDLKTPLDAENGFYNLRYDNLHPAPEGYAQMGRNWFAALEDFLPPLNKTKSASVSVKESVVANRVVLTFDKVMNKTAVENVQNYSLSTRGTITAAKLLDDGLTVVLSLEGVTPATATTLSVASMLDKYGVASEAMELSLIIGANAERTTDIVDGTCDRTIAGYNNPLDLIAEWAGFAVAPTTEVGVPAQFGSSARSERAWTLKALRGQPTVENGVLNLNGGAVTVEMNPDFDDLCNGASGRNWTVFVETEDAIPDKTVIYTMTTSGGDNFKDIYGLQTGATANAVKTVNAGVDDVVNNGFVDSAEVPVRPRSGAANQFVVSTTSEGYKAWVNTEPVGFSSTDANKQYNGMDILRFNFGGTYNEASGDNAAFSQGSNIKIKRIAICQGVANTQMLKSFVFSTTEATINVGDGDGQYTTWNAAKNGLKLADEMESVTINFTDAGQTFTFDDSATLGVVTVKAEGSVTGGAIALGNDVDIVSTSLSLQTNVTAPVAFYNSCEGAVTAASATTVVAMNDNSAATLTATVVGGILKQVGEGSVTFAPTADWKTSATPAKFEVANGTLVFNKTRTNWIDPPQLIVSGGTLDLNNTYTYRADDGSGYLTSVSPVVIMGGATETRIENGAITLCTPSTDTQTLVQYLGGSGQNEPATFAANVHSVYTNNARTAIIDVEQGAKTGGYDLDISGTIGLTEQQFAGTTLKKTGAGVLKISGVNNFPKFELVAGKVLVASTSYMTNSLVVAAGTTMEIAGTVKTTTMATSQIAGTVTVEDDGVLDLRAVEDLSTLVVTGGFLTVKAGGRILVKSGATVPDTIVFETGAILGICPASVDDIGNATLTVNVTGTAATTATKTGYKTDGVTPLTGWADKGATGNTLSFGYNPIFDGELCWWAYEFDADENTTNTTSDTEKIGPMSTGRDKGRMNFDGWSATGRVFDGDEYVDNGDGTKALKLAASAWREVDGYPTAFTATMYGKLTSSKKTILLGFGNTQDYANTIALVTGTSPNEVNLVWVKGHEGDNGDYPQNCVTTLATTTVPNATTKNHLFGFSYELKDTDKNGTADTTEIIFYVDGDKYQPYKVKEIIPLGNGFQTGSIHRGWPREGKAPTASDWLNRMGDNDADATIEFLRVYDDVLPEATFAAMAKTYDYISNVGRATRTIVAGADSTWHESSGDPLTGEWSQVTVVGGVVQAAVPQDHPNFGTIEHPEVGTQVVLNVNGANTLYLNKFYSDPIQEVSKLYYERLEINPVNQSGDSLTLWAGRLNPAIEEEDPLKNSQSAVINVQGYTKINTNVTMAHNVAFLSGPVSVAEGKTLTFDFSGFDVMKVPMMPTEYRLTGYLDEETRERVTHNFQGDNLTVNARWVDLSYKTDVNQYTFKVDRYPVTAYFRNQDDIDLGADGVNASQTAIDFNNLYYMWKGLTSGKRMDWDVDTVDANGNHVDEHILANFVSVDAETQQPKMVTVTLDTIDGTPIDLTLPATALKKTVTHGNDGNGDPIWEEVNMLGAEQLIVGEKVTVDYTGDDAGELAPFVKDVVGMVKAKAMTATEWRGNLTLDNGEDAVAIAGENTVSGKLVLGKSVSFAADADVTAKDADLTAVKNIRIVYDANKTEYKLLTLGEGHTAKSLEGCTVTAVDGEDEYTWTESGETKKLVVIRNNALYVVGRPLVKANETEITNNGLTLPLARRAAELGATTVTLTGVVNMKGETMKDVSVADAAEVFTNVAFDMTETPDGEGAVTAALKYDFGVSQINVVTIEEQNGEDETVEKQYVVAELIVSNHTDLGQNSAAYADGTTINVTVKVGNQSVVADKDIVPVADITGADVATAAELPASTRYVRFPMPGGNGTFEIKARASKKALAQQ